MAKTALDFASELTGSIKGQQPVSSSSNGSASGANVTSVDRAFRSKMLRG